MAGSKQKDNPCSKWEKKNQSLWIGVLSLRCSPKVLEEMILGHILHGAVNQTRCIGSLFVTICVRRTLYKIDESFKWFSEKLERNNSIKIKSLMFWALGKYLLKHVVFKWQKMSYHLYTSEFPSSWSDVADQTSRPGLSSAHADRFPYGRPLLVGWANGLSGFRLFPSSLSFSLSLPSVSSSTSPFCLLLLLRCASSCAEPSDRIERNTWEGRKHLLGVITCDLQSIFHLDGKIQRVWMYWRWLHLNIICRHIKWMSWKLAFLVLKGWL